MLIRVDTEHAPELVNSRMAHVSVSRAQFDVQMYTNDAKTLGYELNKEVSKATALSRQEWLRGGETCRKEIMGSG